MCEGMYFGECLTRVLDMSQSLNRKIVSFGEPSFCHPQSFAEVTPVRFFRLCDLLPPTVWWKDVSIRWSILRSSWDRTVVFFSHSPILSRLSPIKDFLFPTTVPCRLVVRFPHPWGRVGPCGRSSSWSYCPWVYSPVGWAVPYDLLLFFVAPY